MTRGGRSWSWGVGRKKQVRYKCCVRLKNGVSIQTVAMDSKPGIAMLKTTAFMLQYLCPQYRGGNIFIRKLELLRQQHGLSIGDFEMEKVAVEGRKKNLYQCHLNCEVEPGNTIEVKTLAYSGYRAKDLAAQWFLHRYFGYLKNKEWQARQAAGRS